MAEEIVRVNPSGQVLTIWEALGAKTLWEEVAQIYKETGEKVEEPAGQTTRGIKSLTVNQSQSFTFGSEAEAKIPEGAIIKKVVMHWWGKPSAAANKLTWSQPTGGADEISPKSIEPGVVTARWYKAEPSVGDLANISRGSLISSFRVGWTNSKATEARCNVIYIDVGFEPTGAAQMSMLV